VCLGFGRKTKRIGVNGKFAAPTVDVTIVGEGVVGEAIVGKGVAVEDIGD